MPRPRRAQGRPGTLVFPHDFETGHAPVVRRAATVLCKILPPTTGTDSPQVNDDLSYETPGPVTPLYDGTARVQVLNAQDTSTLVGDQDQRTTGYLVVIDLDAALIPANAVVLFPTATDVTLTGNRRLYVRKVASGSVRWERDLWCVDDITRPYAPTPPAEPEEG